jgi:hypothetical protein
MRLSKLEAIGSFLLAAALTAPAWATSTSANTALPGTLNYVEGQVWMGTQANSWPLKTERLRFC